MEHLELLLQDCALYSELYFFAGFCWKHLHGAGAIPASMVKRAFPYRQLHAPACLGGDETDSIMIGVTSFVGQGQQAVRIGFDDDLFKGSNCNRQMFEKLLVSDAARHALPEKYWMCACDIQCFAGFLPPYLGVHLPRSVLLPEVIVAGSAVRGKDHNRFFHLLQQGPKDYDFV